MKLSLIAVLATMGLAACGTSSDPNYFTLDTVKGVTAPDVKTVIQIRRPDIPDFLDRPEFVGQNGPISVSIDDADHWAEPLDKGIARTLQADLQQRLPASLVVTEDDVMPRDIPYEIDLTLQKFNLVGDSQVALEGEVRLVSAPSGSSDLIPIALTAASEADPSSVASALSQTIGDLADNLVGNLKVK